MMWDYGTGGMGWLWMSITMLLFWGVVTGLGVWVISALTGQKQAGDAAVESLRRRLAGGEITLEEFERAKKALGA